MLRILIGVSSTLVANYLGGRRAPCAKHIVATTVVLRTGAYTLAVQILGTDAELLVCVLIRKVRIIMIVCIIIMMCFYKQIMHYYALL